MVRIAVTILVVVRVSAAAVEPEPRDPPATPAEEYAALLKESQADSVSFRKSGTDEERKAAVEQMEKYALRFVDFAESHPTDPMALEAAVHAIRLVNSVDSLTMLTWEMNRTAFPERGEGDPGGRIVALLLREHLRSEKLDAVCDRMPYGLREEHETFLRAVLQSNPHRRVQGLACIALAQFLNTRLLKLDLIKDRPELAERFERLLGKKCFERLRRQDRAEAGKEVEAWFEKAAVTYGDVELFWGGEVGAKARSELFELRELAVGKPAPDIEGVDQDGKAFKLSDYRGKVVLLDFWQEL